MEKENIIKQNIIHSSKDDYLFEKTEDHKYAENSIHASPNPYGVSGTIIRYWMKVKINKLIRVTNKLNIITLGYAKVALSITIVNEILDFVLCNRALSNGATSNHIIYELWSIDQKYKEKFSNSLQKWCYRFMHWNYLNFRRSTHISQKFPENYSNWMQEFLCYNIKFRSKYDF